MNWLVAAAAMPGLIVSCGLAFALRTLAPKWGLVDRPGHRKVHVEPTPFGGGLAIWAGVVVPLALAQIALAIWNRGYRDDPVSAGLDGSALGAWGTALAEFIEPHLPGLVEQSRDLWFFLAAGTILMVLGLVDDVRKLDWRFRLAVQTALLDHLSNGRLIVGTGRGSAYNEYEYLGFGTTLEEGRKMLPEAEELLVKAWTGNDVEHKGHYWQATFPALRPRPYQKPHPPLVRACISEDSVVEMAKLGRPVLIGIQTLETLRHRFKLFRDTMFESEFTEEAVEAALDQSWAQRALYVAGSDEEAREVATAALQRYREHLLDARIKYNPGGVPPRPPGQAPPPGEVVEIAFLAGTPETVADGISGLKEAGVRNLLLNFNVGQMPPAQVEKSMRLFGEKVLPRFKSR